MEDIVKLSSDAKKTLLTSQKRGEGGNYIEITKKNSEKVRIQMYTREIFIRGNNHVEEEEIMLKLRIKKILEKLGHRFTHV